MPSEGCLEDTVDSPSRYTQEWSIESKLGSNFSILFTWLFLLSVNIWRRCLYFWEVWNKQHKEPPTLKTTGSLVFNSLLNTPPRSLDRSLDQYCNWHILPESQNSHQNYLSKKFLCQTFFCVWVSIELQTEEEESDLLNEDDYIGGNKYGEYTVKMFSKRALFSCNFICTWKISKLFSSKTIFCLNQFSPVVKKSERNHD